MTWISFASFEILINGKPHRKISPSRGVRQRDHLSPFLFILCAEMLAKRFKQAESDRSIEGVQIARSSPRISHLFFADDSFFFCKARQDQVELISQLLKDYSVASGHRINLSKSSITFGYRVSRERRMEIKEFTGITSEGGGSGIYLGLP